MSGEDFGRYGRVLKVPGLSVRLGATPSARLAASAAPGGTPVPGLHSSGFAPDAALTLQTGVKTLVALTLAVLKLPAPLVYTAPPSPRAAAPSSTAKPTAAPKSSAPAPQPR